MGGAPLIAVRVCPEPVRVGPVAAALLRAYEAQYGMALGVTLEKAG